MLKSSSQIQRSSTFGVEFRNKLFLYAAPSLNDLYTPLLFSFCWSICGKTSSWLKISLNVDSIQARRNEKKFMGGGWAGSLSKNVIQFG